MNKLTMAVTAASFLSIAGLAQAADVTAQAMATWSATAKKDTTSKLVVVPTGSLTFNYAEGIKGFNTQKGLFDVTIEGDSAATDFKLTSRLVSNTLTQLGNSGSTLDVGVRYNGEALNKATQLTMIDTSAGILGGNLGALASNYNVSSRTSAQDMFDFTITGGTSDGTTAVNDFSELPEGIWSGDVSVEFNATWTV